MQNLIYLPEVISFTERHHLSQATLSELLLLVCNPLSSSIFDLYQQHQLMNSGVPLIVGINGAQGSGKTTMSELLAIVLKHQYALNSVSISIDDFYKTRQQRNKMATTIHPLFATRGVPGTHDVELAINIFKSLKNNNQCRQLKTLPIMLPKFDKATDDRAPKTSWTRLSEAPSIVIFEGWCVGTTAQQQSDLIEPVNSLEREQDQELNWRQKVNQALQSDYKELFSLIDFLIFLQAPSFHCVAKWRKQQEHQLIERLKSQNLAIERTMTDLQIETFVMHFERLTQHNLTSMPSFANLVIALDQDRRPGIIN